MQDEEGFRAYLDGVHVGMRTGKSMSPRAINDCLSRLRRAEKVLGVVADATLCQRAKLHDLTDRLKSSFAERGLSKSAVQDCMTAMHRYVEFQSKR